MAEFSGENVEIVGADLVVRDGDGNERARVEGATGQVTIKTADGVTVVTLTESGDITLGGTGSEGELGLRSSGDVATLHLEGELPGLAMNNPDDQEETVKLDGKHGNLTLGGPDHDGDLALQSSGDVKTVHLGGDHPQLKMSNPDNQAQTVNIDGRNGNITLGGNGHDGDLILKSAGDMHIVEIDEALPPEALQAAAGRILSVSEALSTVASRTRAAGEQRQSDSQAGSSADRDRQTVVAELLKASKELHLLAAGALRTEFTLLGSPPVQTVHLGGDRPRLRMYNPDDEVQTIHVDGRHGNLTLGGGEHDGDLRIRDANGREALNFNGGTAYLVIGAEDNEGDIEVLDNEAESVFHFNGANAILRLGGTNNEGDLIVRDGDGNDRIHLDGGSGDIKLSGGDCAEDFDVRDASFEVATPGTVMVIAEDSKVEPCSSPYDTRVVGIVSGAGDTRPGVILGRMEEVEGRRPIALNGRVYCKVDASYGAIGPGDLLTTSATPGHAMRAGTTPEAAGAIVGKAMADLDEGTGVIPVLVTLH